MSEVLSLSLSLDEPADSKRIIPEPKKRIKKSKNVVDVYPDIKVWFSHCLRQTRMKEKIPQREAAKKMGIRSLSEYQKLEKRANPTIETVRKIKKAFPSFDVSEAMHG